VVVVEVAAVVGGLVVDVEAVVDVVRLVSVGPEVDGEGEVVEEEGALSVVVEDVGTMTLFGGARRRPGNLVTVGKSPR
jgi:hypothetical protein